MVSEEVEQQQEVDNQEKVELVHTPTRVANEVADIGKRLGQAREMRNYGIKEVASELNLAPTVVSALEVGDMKRLPEMTYIRGYLRAYARLLGLSDELDGRINDELRDRGLYEESSASRFIVADGSPLAPSKTSSIGGGVGRLLLYVLPIAVIGGIIWLVTQRSDMISDYIKLPELPAITGETEEVVIEEEPSTVEVKTVLESEEIQATNDASTANVASNIDPVAEEEGNSASAIASAISSGVTTVGNAAESASENVQDNAEEIASAVGDILSVSAEQAEEIPVDGAADAAESAESEDQGEAADSTSNNEKSEAIAQGEDDEVAGEEEAEAGAEDENSDGEASESNADESSAATSNGTSLVVNLSNDSWIEIKDANNKTIVKRLARAGEAITANGAVPLSVILGNASGAKVSFDGDEVDLDEHIRGNVARFEVGR